MSQAVAQPPAPRRPAVRLAAVAVPIPVDEAFTYALPPGVEAPVGVRVEVPLGRRRVVGYVVGRGTARGGDVKEIVRVVDAAPVLTPDVIEATRRAARRFAAPWYRLLEAAAPPSMRLGGPFGGRRADGPRVVRYLRLAPAGQARTEGRALSAPARAALEVVRDHPLAHEAATLARAVGASRGVVRTLLGRGLVEEVPVEVPRDPFRDHPVARDVPPALTPEQAAALGTIRRAVEGDGPRVVVLRGVTGSGKTEVYLRAIHRVLDAGGGAIALVPEISLTPQTVDRFRARFGDDRVALLHSALAPAERADEWRRLASGRARIAVGARSAVFAPVRDLRLVVVDEEQEATYKQADPPRYHAREVAIFRAEAAGAAVVLGSATPSVEAEARARAGAWASAVLPRRIDDRPLPPVEVVDMRDELAAGNASILSGRLAGLLDETLAAGLQAILLVNRRGLASFLLCRTCGRTVRCDRCDAAMTLHRRPARPALRCHLCEARRDVPRGCPGCGAPSVRPYGLGTQRLEAEVRRAFPRARLARMDADTTVRRGSHREILGAFARGAFDVLVGTQMVGKGLDVPNVALVGVVAAETALSLPDFRAGERTFDLIVQVAGRSGRGPAGGRVVVQTYRPEHPVIRAAAAHDYDAFYAREIEIRRASGLPPFADLARVLARSADEEVARALAERAAEAVGAAVPDIDVIAPAPAPIERVRGEWRWAFFARRGRDPSAPADDAFGAALSGALRRVKVPRGAHLAVDVDPLDVL